MMCLLWAELLKTKRSALRLLLLVGPLGVGAVLAWYVAGRPWISAASAFSGFFSVWAALVLPLGIAIVSGWLAQEEEGAGAFSGWLLSAKPRAELYLSKFLVLVLTIVFATTLSLSIFCAGLWLGGCKGVEVACYLQAGAIVCLAALPLGAFHLWLALGTGMGVSVGVGMGGMLVAALMGTTLLGDAVWPFVPWAWPVRLASAPLILRLTTLDSPQLVFFLERVHWACAFGAVRGMLLLVGGQCWFSRWGGRSASE